MRKKLIMLASVVLPLSASAQASDIQDRSPDERAVFCSGVLAQMAGGVRLAKEEGKDDDYLRGEIEPLIDRTGNIYGPVAADLMEKTLDRSLAQTDSLSAQDFRDAAEEACRATLDLD